MRPTISVVIPAYNAAAHLEAAVRAAQAALHGDGECVVVDDGSTDETTAIARRLDCRALKSLSRAGAAAARNLGARATSSDLVIFIDADCCAHADVVDRVRAAFDADPMLDAVFGAYDTHPQGNLVSQFRTLLHAFTHRVASRKATTFWTGCGAIRRRTFEAVGGFDETFAAMEDVDLGIRVARQGGLIRLDPAIQVQHRKHWPLGRLIATDIFSRAVPWTELILREGRMPDDLNVRLSQRVSVVLTTLALLTIPLAAVNLRWLLAGAIACAAVVAANAGFYRFLVRERSLGWAARCVPLHLLHFVCAAAGFSFALVREPLKGWRAMMPVRADGRSRT